jgi:undecaprenyl-diphosphatase
MVEYLQAILIAIVEGLTEFIPVSSTGHMILVGHAIGFTGERAATFEVFIQLGAILAVVSLYRERFLGLLPFGIGRAAAASPDSLGGGEVLRFEGWRGIGLLCLTTFPALVAGKLAHGHIKEHLFTPITVAIGLFVGGVALIVAEKAIKKPRLTGLDAVGPREALLIGLFQCLSLWPGVSRAGATIVGGMLFGLDRKTTAEYSFMAAVPIMMAAVSYDLYKSWSFLRISDAPLFLVGFVVAFISAWFAIRYFIKFLANHTLVGFGWYRIVVAAVAWWYFSGHA